MFELKSIVYDGFRSLDIRLITTDEYCKEVVERDNTTFHNGDELYYKKYADGTYDFGLIQGDYASFGHSKGYIWSSRASVINQFFGLNLIEVGIYYGEDSCCAIKAMDVEDVRKLLPKEFAIFEDIDENGEREFTLCTLVHKGIKCDDVLFSRDNKDTGCTPVYNMTTILLNRDNCNN